MRTPTTALTAALAVGALLVAGCETEDASEAPFEQVGTPGDDRRLDPDQPTDEHDGEGTGATEQDAVQDGLTPETGVEN